MVPVNNNNKLSNLENWLWQAACTIRGEIDAPKFKDYILPLIFCPCTSTGRRSITGLMPWPR